MAPREPDWTGLFQDRQLHAHILHGTRKAGDRFSGLHFTPMGRPPPDREVSRRPEPWKNGTYLVDVFVRGRDGRLHAKAGTSTMFPDEWSKREVFGAGESALRDAWRRGNIDPKTGAWEGRALGIWNSRMYLYHISGYVSLENGSIKRVKTFFPSRRPAIVRAAKEKRDAGVEL